MRPSFAILLSIGWGYAGPLLAHGAIDDRLAEVSRALLENPADSRLWFDQAGLHLEHADPLAALISLDRLDHLQPVFPGAAVRRAEALLATARPEAAIALLDELTSREPAHVAALALRARCYEALDQPAPALLDYQKAMMAETPPAAALMQETAALLIRQGQAREAAVLLADAIRLHGEGVSLLQLSLTAETASSQWDNALQRVQSLRNSDPLPEKWMARRAEILTLAGRTEEARRAWQDLTDFLAALPNLERGTAPRPDLARRAAAALAAPAGS